MNNMGKESLLCEVSRDSDTHSWDESWKPAKDPPEQLEKPSLWPHLQPNTPEMYPLHVLLSTVIPEYRTLQRSCSDRAHTMRLAKHSQVVENSLPSFWPYTPHPSACEEALNPPK